MAKSLSRRRYLQTLWALLDVLDDALYRWRTPTEAEDVSPVRILDCANAISNWCHRIDLGHVSVPTTVYDAARGLETELRRFCEVAFLQVRGSKSWWFDVTRLRRRQPTEGAFDFARDGSLFWEVEDLLKGISKVRIELIQSLRSDTPPDDGLVPPYSARTMKVVDGCRSIFVGSEAYWRRGQRSELPEPSIPIDVYLDTDDETASQRVIDAAQALAEVLGYEGSVDERIHRGSIWRRAKAILKQGATSGEVQDRLVKVERALELRHIDLHQAEMDSKEAEAVSALVNSLADIPQACVRVGSILLIKFSMQDGAVILTRSMSQPEIRAFERFPEIQLNPRFALEALATAVANMESVSGNQSAPTPPTSAP